MAATAQETKRGLQPRDGRLLILQCEIARSSWNFGQPMPIVARIFPAGGRVIQRSLSNIVVFQQLDAAERRRIEAACSWRRYQPGETIAPAHERTREVMFLVAGRARTSITSATGNVVAFGDLLPGMMFGEIAAIDGEPRAIDVEATTACTVARLPHQAFLKLIGEQPGFALSVLVQISSNIRRLTARIFEFSTLPVKSRVHAELLRLASQSAASGARGNSMILSPAPKHAAVAARISTHREAVTREFNALVKDGLLKKDGADLVICDIGRLRRLVDEALAREA